MLYVSVICGVSLVCFLFAAAIKKPVIKKKSKLSMWGYSLIYSDSRGSSHNKNVEYSKLLKSEKYDITGKPDYIYKKAGSNQLIPVELKSGDIKSGNMPHQGDLLQLGAYFLIIEEAYGVRPKKGRLVYKDYMFIVKNTSSIRNEVKTTINDMRRMLKDGNGKANSSFVTCRHCMCRGSVCEL